MLSQPRAAGGGPKRLSELTQDDLILDISPNEVTFTHSLHYFEMGLAAVRYMDAALHVAPYRESPRAVRRILDLPCGHGRVLRVLRAGFPEAEITACDISRDGVDFCARTFNAIPVYSDETPAKIVLEGSYDLIWCGSLLTHVDAGLWEDFLDLFESVLAPDGVLVFTSHGRGVADKVRRDQVAWGTPPEVNRALLDEYDRDGFGYRNYPGQQRYGLSLASPSWVCERFEKRPQLRLLTYGEMGWNGFQDIVSCVRRSIENVQVAMNGRELPPQ